jgi:hypothetical protein
MTVRGKALRAWTWMVAMGRRRKDFKKEVTGFEN